MIGRMSLARRIAVGVGIAVAILAGGAVFIRAQAPPAEAEHTAREFVTVWNRGDFRRAYGFLSTPIAEDIFVEAVTRSTLPIHDLRIERMSRLDARRVEVAYSGVIPDVDDAVLAIVLANRLRYPASCSEAGQRRAQARRLEDTLDLEESVAGTWQIGLRGESDFLEHGANLISLDFDFAPQFIWGHITADVDPRDAHYDDLVIFDALSVYRNDLAPIAAGQDVIPSITSVREHLASVTRACRNSQTGLAQPPSMG